MGFFDNLNPFKKKQKDEFGMDMSNPPQGLPGSLPQDFSNNPFDGGAGKDPYSNPGSADPYVSTTYPQESPQQFDSHSNPPTFGQSATQSAYGQQRPLSSGGGASSDDLYKIHKEIEIISSKIDALRAGVESISQRLGYIEKLAQAEVDEARKTKW